MSMRRSEADNRNQWWTDARALVITKDGIWQYNWDGRQAPMGWHDNEVTSTQPLNKCICRNCWAERPAPHWLPEVCVILTFVEPKQTLSMKVTISFSTYRSYFCFQFSSIGSKYIYTFIMLLQSCLQIFVVRLHLMLIRIRLHNQTRPFLRILSIGLLASSWFAVFLRLFWTLIRRQEDCSQGLKSEGNPRC